MPPGLKQMFGAIILDFEPRIVNLRDLSMGAQDSRFCERTALYMLNAIWTSSSRMLERLLRISESMSLIKRSELTPRTVNCYLDHHSE